MLPAFCELRKKKHVDFCEGPEETIGYGSFKSSNRTPYRKFLYYKYSSYSAGCLLEQI